MKEPCREQESSNQYSLSKRDVHTYLCLRLGITKQASRQYLNALAEYLGIALAHGLTVELPNIGNIELHKKERYKAKFTLHSRLRKLVDIVRPAYTAYLRAKGLTDLADHVRDSLQKYSLKKQPTQADKSLEEHPIQRNFLKYLQNDLIWDRDWEHPLTKQVFTAAVIRETLIHYRTLNIYSYELLFLIWLGTSHRQIRLQHYEISEQDLYAEWLKAVNNLLLLLLFPELDPKLLQGLTLSKDVRTRSRDTSSAESSERYGVYRADRASGYKPGGLEKYFAP